LALELLQGDYGHTSTKFLLAQVERLHHWEVDTWSPFSGLHCASFFGITQVVAELIETGYGDTDGRDLLGYTPLAWATHSGHEQVVGMLLRREEVNPQKREKKGRTPLSIAALSGHEGVVKMLLGREEVNPDKPDNGGVTPL